MVDWLDEDWVFCTGTWEFSRKKRVRPPVKLQVHRCGAQLRKMFRQYYYLNGTLGAGVRCYTTNYQDKRIAFVGVVRTHMKRNYFRVSRLVVLPDYQGIGVGKRFLNFVAELYSSQMNLPFILVTSNPQLVRGNLKNWKVNRYGHANHGRGNTRINQELNKSNSRQRLSVTLAYRKEK